MSINLRRYTLWFAGASMALHMLVALVFQLTSVSLGTAFTVIIPPLVAAMVEGALWAKGTREPIPSPWKSAAAMTGLGIAVTFVLAMLTSGALSGRTVPYEALLLLLAICALIWFPMNRIFLGLGARNEWASQGRPGG